VADEIADHPAFSGRRSSVNQAATKVIL